MAPQRDSGEFSRSCLVKAFFFDVLVWQCNWIPFHFFFCQTIFLGVSVAIRLRPIVGLLPFFRVFSLHLFHLGNGNILTGDEPGWKDEGHMGLDLSSLGVNTASFTIPVCP